MKARVGIDVGGTSLRCALYTSKWKRIAQTKRPTPPTGTESVLQAIYDSIDTLLKQHPDYEMQSIGVGLPGPIDTKRGVLRYTVNIPGFVNVPLHKKLKRRYPSISSDQIVLANDANCAALGESFQRDIQTLFYIGLGTGVGSGFVQNGRLYTGRSIAPEIGHTVINFNGPSCICGSKGCLEQYVGVAGVKRLAQKHCNSLLSAYDLAQRAYQHDSCAVAAYQEYGLYLGIGLTTIVNAFDPAVIVIGGGIMHEATLFMPIARQELKKRMFSKSLPRIVYSKKRDNGLLGAALLALKQKKTST